MRVTSITNIGFTVSWVTEEKTHGGIAFGNSASLGQIAQEDTTKVHLVHSITITGLKPETEYSFKLIVGEQTFDNNGNAWKQKTAGTLTPRVADIISGVVNDSSGTPVAGAIVYITLPAAAPESAVTNEEGHWSLSLASVRTSDLTAFAQYDDSTILSLFAQAGKGSISSAQVTIGNARPVPPLVLGETHDFRKSTQVGELTSPQAQLGFTDQAELKTTETPETQTESRFILESLEGVPTPSPIPLSIENPEQGETILTDTPEFRGSAPAGTTITITIESSHVVTQEVTVPKNGEWTWNPPESLTNGEHTITVKGNGNQSVSSFFTVLAAESDSLAFTSTPSGQTSPPPASPVPGGTGAGGPTPSPTPTSSPKPSPSPTSSPRSATSAGGLSPTPATSASVPISGDLTITLGLLILGLTSLFGGILLITNLRYRYHA